MMTQAPAQPAARKRSKYGNVVVRCGGNTFGSRAEFKRWQVLAMLERAGEINELALQVPFELIPKQVSPSGKKERSTVYLADFAYKTKTGEFVVEDVKGAATDIWRIKRKLMLHVHGIDVKEVRA